MAAIPRSVSSSSDDMVHRPRVRPIEQDDRIAQHLKARTDARMLWPQDKHLEWGSREGRGLQGFCASSHGVLRVGFFFPLKKDEITITF